MRRRSRPWGCPSRGRSRPPARMTGSAMRWRSTSLQLVPPAPATSSPATPASASARAMSSPMPQPTSLTSTGTSTAAATSPMRSSSPAKRGVPSGWSASWRGLAWSTSASASIIVHRPPAARRRASGSRSWATPRLAMQRHVRAPARAPGRSRPAPASSRAARCEPTPIATPAACAARGQAAVDLGAALHPAGHARDHHGGGEPGRPRSSRGVSTSPRSSSGSAWWTKR